ncbi:hypothetical protein PVL29_024289 [Vitis rotundifolia]|uniref:Uncharacterized protein n=1 Tax=Vitis rotundifolia TaxID=103349 RepID=A0AA38YRF2_VITRO|nr:hypothetical protein PVL29_024289 [Vitis rotundifolia]
MAKASFEQRGFKQGLLEGRWMTMMDWNKRLYCLLLNPTLKFSSMSSSFSSLQMMGGTTNSTPIFCSVLAPNCSTPMSGLVLAAKEDEDRDAEEGFFAL